MYGKLFASTFTGSLLGSGPVVISVWSYVIAHAAGGAVEINPTLVATVIGGISPEQVESAIEALCAPDPKSRSKAEEGRRLIREGEYQYRVVNHGLYRQIRSPEEKREYNRIKQRESRERRKNKLSNDVSKMSTESTNTDTDTEAINKSDKPSANHDADADLVLEKINASRAKFMKVRKTRSKALTAKARSFLREMSLDDLDHILATWEDDCTRGASGDYDPLRHFTAVTVLRPTSYLKRLDRPAPKREQGRKPTMGLDEARRMFPDASDEDLQRSFGGAG